MSKSIAPVIGVALGLSSAWLIAACAAGPAPFLLPQHNRPAVGASTFATGGRVAFDGRCVWLEEEGGASANLVWPATFRAMAPPLAIIGESGRAIIHEGDTVELAYSEGPVAIPGCPARGAALLVGEISSVNDEDWPDGAPNVAPPGRPPGNPH